MDDSRVAVLLEDLRAQFRSFGEGLQILNDQLDRQIRHSDNEFEKVHRKLDQNQIEHKQMIQMIKVLDKKVQTAIKRVK